MHYLLFNSEILISDGSHVQHLGKNDPKDILGPIEEARLCVVDADVLIAASVESPIEKKDSILVRKFKEFYPHESYIIQDERIDHNLFQIIGIKEQKVREIYSLIPSSKVASFIPYGIAMRNYLTGQRINLNKTVVFVDDQGETRLLTVFDGLKFSRTRGIAHNGEDILSEIKRSQIDFYKKTEGFLNRKDSDFTILVNNKALAGEIAKNAENLQVEWLDVAYPAFKGLDVTESLIKYRLPEEDIEKRREIELKKKIMISVFSLCIVASGLFYFLFHWMGLQVIENKYKLAAQTGERLEKTIHRLDLETYREDLKDHKSFNFGISYLSILDIIPASYTVYSFKYFKTDKWKIEMTLLADEDKVLDQIPRTKILKNAEIKDIFVNNQPGKRVSITL